LGFRLLTNPPRRTANIMPTKTKPWQIRRCREISQVYAHIEIGFMTGLSYNSNE
jgi:hypothetical protein